MTAPANQTRPAVTRRTFLKRAGATTLVVVVGGGVYRAADRGVFSVGQGEAYEPWRTWHEEQASGPMALVQSAILAANPHNSQPWLFRVDETRVDVFADPARNISNIDPFLREKHVGLGCAVENAVLTARALGYRPGVRLLPDPADPAHVARIDLTPGNLTPGDLVVSKLYDAIPNRHTNRAAYDVERPVPPEVLGAIAALNTELDIDLRWFTGAARGPFGEATVAATEALVADAEQMQGSDAWLRLGWDQTQGERDGISLDANGSSLWQRSFLKMLPNSQLGGGAQSNNVFRSATASVQVPTAAAFGLIVVRDADSDVQRLDGGRFWQRLHLWATAEGLAVQPLSQTTERADRERQLGLEPVSGRALAGLIGDSGWRALMPFRVGYPTEAALASPRRALQEVLV